MPQRLGALFQKSPTSGEIAGNTVPPSPAGPLSAYVVPTSRMAVLSTICVCNTNPAPINFYIAIVTAPNGSGTFNVAWYTHYNCSVPANDSAMLTVGWALGPGDAVRVWTPNVGVNFTGLGVEDTYQGEA